MIVLYFSGTGNTKYIANKFAEKMNINSYSIEEKVEFKEIIDNNDTITFCYPVYGSSVPRIMSQFVDKYKENLNNKKLIILITQAMFSGDGARAFTDLLEGIEFEVIYAEHFDMPINIPNIPLINVKNGDKLKSKINKADRKLEKTCRNINSQIIKKRGFNGFSKFLGSMLQRNSFSKMDKKIRDGVSVNEDCVLCSRCVKVCPESNLYIEDKKVKARENCTICNRCVNICPKKAITVLYHNKVKVQYKGIK